MKNFIKSYKGTLVATIIDIVFLIWYSSWAFYYYKFMINNSYEKFMLIKDIGGFILIAIATSSIIIMAGLFADNKF